MSRTWSRRNFLCTSLGAVGVCTLPFARRAKAADEKGRYGGFLMGLQSYSLRAFGVDEALQHIADLGLHSVEFFNAHFDVKSSDQQIADIKAKTEKLGIRILGHGVNPFTNDHEANRRWFEFAKKAGIKNISADPTEDAFESLDKLVAEYNIRIAIHNHGPGARYDKVADVLNAIKGHHELIGACADLGHYIRSDEDPVRVINLLKGRLYGIHLKDFAERTAQTKGVILGEGHLDVEGVFRALKKVDFPADGCLSLEYEENPKNPLDDIKACLAAAAAGAKRAFA